MYIFIAQILYLNSAKHTTDYLVKQILKCHIDISGTQPHELLANSIKNFFPVMKSLFFYTHLKSLKYFYILAIANPRR